MKFVMCYWKYKTFDGKRMAVGGIETYLYNLAKLAQEMGMKPILYQCATEEFCDDIDGLEIRGVKTPTLTGSSKTKKYLYARACEDLEWGNDILVFGSDVWSVPVDYKKAVSLQHGVNWDLPIQYLSRIDFSHSNLGESLQRWRFKRAVLKSFENCPNRVCVDYNFLNWYRTCKTVSKSGNIWIIPNFSEIAPPDEIKQKIATENKEIKIIFARRFEEIRGVKLMAEVAERISGKYDHVSFTFAGMGTLEGWLIRRFSNNSNVEITSYLPNESLEFHKAYSIAVVPSLGSEGTSLSVAEAMATGCAVVATNIGGITNMILHGYNGILVNPDQTELFEAVEKLVTNRSLRKRLAEKGYETASCAFSLDVWKKRWRSVISILNEA